MGIKKNLWKLVKFLIAFFAVFFILCVIAALYMPSIPTPESAPAPVTVTTGKVTDHNQKTSVKVTLKGKKDSYTLSMIGPDETEVSSAFITKTQMADGKQSVWMELVEESKSLVSAKPGTYSLSVTNSSANKVCEKSLGPYSGVDLSIIDTSTSTSFDFRTGLYKVDKLVLKVKNNGDLPAYISGVDVECLSKGGGSTHLGDEEVEIILPNEEATITPKFLYIGFGLRGNFRVAFKLKEGLSGEGKTIATHTTIITVP